jgi:hypothetical protein
LFIIVTFFFLNSLSFNFIETQLFSLLNLFFFLNSEVFLFLLSSKFSFSCRLVYRTFISSFLYMLISFLKLILELF